MRPVLLAILVLYAAPARADKCSANEVPYLGSGCQSPPQKCWPQNVHPTPAEWCGCDGKTFGGTMPSLPWRFMGPCAIEIHFEYVPANSGTPEARSLILEGSSFAMPIGKYDGCTEVAPAKDMLLHVSCTGDRIKDDVQAAHIKDELVVSLTNLGGERREVGRQPSPALQKITVKPLTIFVPPPPSPFEVRFDSIPDRRHDGTPTGARKIILLLDGGTYDAGIFTSCADAPPEKDVVVALDCVVASGAHHHLAVTRQGNTMVLSVKPAGQATNELKRVDFDDARISGRVVVGAPLRVW